MLICTRQQPSLLKLNIETRDKVPQIHAATFTQPAFMEFSQSCKITHVQQIEQIHKGETPDCYPT